MFSCYASNAKIRPSTPKPVSGAARSAGGRGEERFARTGVHNDQHPIVMNAEASGWRKRSRCIGAELGVPAQLDQGLVERCGDDPGPGSDGRPLEIGPDGGGVLAEDPDRPSV